MRALSAFAARRVLTPWFGAGLFVLFALAARHGEPLVADGAARAALRALARTDVWSVLAACAPLVFLQAARLGTAQANRWLAPTPSAPLARAAALALGCAPACLAITLLAALVSEASVEGAGGAWTRTENLASPRAVLLDDVPVVRWTVRWRTPGPGARQRLRLWTSVAIGSGPTATARFTARAGETSAVCEARVAGRTALELEPPAGAELELELERVGNGALLVLPPDALEVLAPRTSERGAALALGLHAFWLLAAGSALALGLGRWLHPGLAAGLVASLVFLACTRDAPGGPFGAVPRAFVELGQGLVPAAPPLAAWGVTALLFALGVVLQGSPRRRA